MKKVLNPYNRAAYGLFFLALFASVAFIIYVLFIDYRFREIEKREALKHLQRAQAILNYMAKRLESTVADYARWDETWFFALGASSNFPQKYLTPKSLSNLDVDGVALYNAKGVLLFSLFRSKGTFTSPTVEDPFSDLKESTKANFAGLWAVSGIPYIFASREILHSDGTGPLAGRLLFAREIQEDFLAEWQELSGLQVQIEIIDPAESPKEEFEPKIQITKTAIHASSLLPDCAGKKRFILRIYIVRDLFSQQFRIVQFPLIVFIFFALLIGGIFFNNMKLVKGLNQLNEHLDGEVQKQTHALALYREILQNMSEGVLILDMNRIVVFANLSFIHMFGYTPEELLQKPLGSLQVFTELPEPISSSLQESSVFPKWKGEVSAYHKDGNRKPVWATFENLEEHLIAIFFDITQLKHLEERLNFMAYFDPLTHLPNRALFQDRLSTAIIHAQRKKQRLALLYLDLDHFKNINDGFGHQVGDALLILVANRISQLLRKDDSVCRLGGDEFTVILESLERSKDATIVAEKIIHALQEPFHIESLDIYTGTSIGIALYPFDGQTTEE
ncbi:MAG: diguanylate cyclase, partial [Spirochaetales bacterium]